MENKHSWASFRILLIINWADFVLQNWQPCFQVSMSTLGCFAIVYMQILDMGPI